MNGLIENIKRTFKDKKLPVVMGIYVLMTAVYMLCTTTKEGSEFIGALPLELLIPTCLAILVGAIAYVLILYGFSFQFMHNVFNDNFEDKLPDWSLSQFKLSGKAIPLAIVWFLYVILMYIAFVVVAILGGAILGILSKLLAPLAFALGFLFAIGLIAGFIAFILYMIFTTYIWVSYSENYVAAGLYNILLPFKFMRAYLKDTVILCLKVFALYLVSMILLIPAFINLGKNDLYLLSDLPLILLYSVIMFPIWLGTMRSFVELYKTKRMNAE